MVFWCFVSLFRGLVMPVKYRGKHVSFNTFSRKTSLFVNLLTAINESCTIPMTGLFDCGVTMFLGTIMISVISARASRD